MKMTSLNYWWRKRDATVQVLLASVGFSIALLVFRIAYSGSLALLFLAWNGFLALLPWALGRVLRRRVDWIERPFPFYALFLGWLLFLPNTFYITTDLLHLRPRPGIPVWFDLVLLFSFAWNGLLLGMLTLRDMEAVAMARWGLRKGLLFSIPVLALSGLGVFIGRYWRYNSWDVLTAPGGLLRDLAGLLLHPVHNRFDWSMIICFTGLLVLLYASLRRLAASFS
ncbi:DUF1361 domain-containing protein [Flaviaesturariibacter amylovorans]|uniref:DUF1361 domain-containing protein n=1 Tax=Flaviaesturariibacter amylovorans TaxID=1084520 RepID=A0ABP8GD94_9BACT